MLRGKFSFKSRTFEAVFGSKHKMLIAGVQQIKVQKDWNCFLFKVSVWYRFCYRYCLGSADTDTARVRPIPIPIPWVRWITNHPPSPRCWSTLRYICIQYHIIIQGYQIFRSLNWYRFSITIQGDNQMPPYCSYLLSSMKLSSGNNCIPSEKLKSLRSFLFYSMRLL